MQSYDEQLEVLKRIITLETKLGVTISKLDALVDMVKDRYEGNSQTPSIVSRIIQLEEFKKTALWSLSVLYSAVIAAVSSLLVYWVKAK